jgi:hypothetical protein
MIRLRRTSSWYPFGKSGIQAVDVLKDRKVLEEAATTIESVFVLKNEAV